MVQSDIPRGQTQSGKINAKWYLERLKASAIKHSNYFNQNKINSNDTIRVVRGTTATQGKHMPRVFLKSPDTSPQFINDKQKLNDNRQSSSIHIPSATSLKSLSTSKISPSISELNCNSYQSLSTTTIHPKDEKDEKDEKDDLFQRRNSSGTLLSCRADLIARPPSTPVDPRCSRDYLSTANSIQKETCQLLGPQLCSDCIEIQTRSNLSPERLPNNLIHQRLSSLAIRRFIKDQQYLTDDHLLKLVNEQKIQFTNKISDQLNNSIITDEEYFHNLTSSLNQSPCETPYYFKDLKDFSQKYQSNKYPRLLLSQTPAPKSENVIFKESSFEKFDISSKYSYMKQASTIKPNFKSNISIFISPKKSEQFYQQHRYLINYSPPLLLHKSKFNQTNHSRLSTNSTNQTIKKSLINSKYSNTKTIQI